MDGLLLVLSPVIDKDRCQASIKKKSWQPLLEKCGHGEERMKSRKEQLAHVKKKSFPTLFTAFGRRIARDSAQ